jgi:hypothetical protein
VKVLAIATLGGWRKQRRMSRMRSMSAPVHHLEGGVRRRRANRALVRQPPRRTSCLRPRAAPALEAEDVDESAQERASLSRSAPPRGSVALLGVDKQWLAAWPQVIGQLVLGGLRAAATRVSKRALRSV